MSKTISVPFDKFVQQLVYAVVASNGNTIEISVDRAVADALSKDFQGSAVKEIVAVIPCD